jgi:hypothetical protein
MTSPLPPDLTPAPGSHPYPDNEIKERYDAIEARALANIALWSDDAWQAVFSPHPWPAAENVVPLPVQAPTPSQLRASEPPAPADHRKLKRRNRHSRPEAASAVPARESQRAGIWPRPAQVPVFQPEPLPDLAASTEPDTLHPGQVPVYDGRTPAERAADEAAAAKQARSQAALLEVPGVSAEDLAHLARPGDGTRPEPLPGQAAQMTQTFTQQEDR